nr:hypothetical protein [Tanacetum cinerariifolium]
AEIEGHCIHRMYVDGGSASKILYEHCFNRVRPEIKKQLVSATIPLIGFSGEIIWPIGQIQLLVRIGDEEHSASDQMNFLVVRSPSPYNGIIGRLGVRKLQAIPSTAHGMLKLPVEGGQVNSTGMCIGLRTRRDPPGSQTNSGRKNPSGNKPRISGANNNDRFHSNQRGPQQVGCSPVRKKKRGQAADRNQAIQKEVGKLVEADFKDLNKACPKDGYPLPEIDWKVESLCGFPFKFFLDAYKGYHQIQMAKEDKEKQRSSQAKEYSAIQRCLSA